MKNDPGTPPSYVEPEHFEYYKNKRLPGTEWEFQPLVRENPEPEKWRKSASKIAARFLIFFSCALFIGMITLGYQLALPGSPLHIHNNSLRIFATVGEIFGGLLLVPILAKLFEFICYKINHPEESFFAWPKRLMPALDCSDLT